MTIDVIETGSTGNAVVINKNIMVECGLPWSKIKPYSKDLQFVLLTHSHS